jgi:hypothetical protein
MHGGSLVGKSGELVTREDMQSKLWSADISASLKHAVALRSSDVRIGGPGQLRAADGRLVGCAAGMRHHRREAPVQL